MTASNKPIPRKTIALIAHDNKKPDMMEWAKYNKKTLSHHRLIATGTTGKLLAETLETDVIRLQSGPLGGDQQIGAKIAEGEIDLIIFFWDPLEPQPHDPDVKALLRLAVAWNIPTACNRATADFIISSPLLTSVSYEPQQPDFATHNERVVPGTVDPTNAQSGVDTSIMDAALDRMATRDNRTYDEKVKEVMTEVLEAIETRFMVNPQSTGTKAK